MKGMRDFRRLKGADEPVSNETLAIIRAEIEKEIITKKKFPKSGYDDDVDEDLMRAFLNALQPW